MIETNDLYFAAYLLAEDFRLTNVTSRSTERFGESVFFQLEGPHLVIEARLEWGYQDGNAEVNLKKFLASLNKVRDILSGLRPDDKATIRDAKRTQKNQGTGHDERGRTERPFARN